MHDLLKEYKDALKKTKELNQSAPEEDKKTVHGIISSLEFTIQWLETGWMPGYKRPLKKRKYHPTKFWDSSMDAFISKNAYVDPFEEVREKIDFEREKDYG